jgi:hypothetical protein
MNDKCLGVNFTTGIFCHLGQFSAKIGDFFRKPMLGSFLVVKALF